MNVSGMSTAVLALVALCATSASGQRQQGGQAWSEAAEQAKVRAIIGDTGLPDAPPLLVSSPHDSMLFEDRRLVGQDEKGFDAADGGPVMQQQSIPPGVGGTGTSIGEFFYYQIPTSYDGTTPLPLVIGYHGYNVSAASVWNQTTIDEECENRGWLFLAPTGIDSKVFGSVPGQMNVEAAIHWMQDNYLVDVDRIYMIGFSMGGGVVTNFASRHRDPDGIMIAAIACVSGTYDWTLTYQFTSPDGKTIMEHPLNFGGTPTAFPFNYQQCSTLFANLGSYPPAPGTNNASISMGDNLHSTPLYLTWDSGDTLVEKPQLMGPQLKSLVLAAGGAAQSVEVSGTVDPTSGNPAPHSWAVLNEVDVFDFFSDKSVDRTPAVVKAQCDRDETVAWFEAKQRTPSAFTWVNGDDSLADGFAVTAVSNAEEVTVDLGAIGKAGLWPLHVVASSADSIGFTLRVTGTDQPWSYLLKTSDGTLLTGQQGNPFDNDLVLEVPGQASFDVMVHSQPWLAKLWTAPEDVPLGGAVTLTFDGPADNAPPFLFLIVSLDEQLQTIKGGNAITAAMATGVLLPLPLDGNADLTLNGSVGTDPALTGLRILFQGIAATPIGSIDSISNLWAMQIQ
jgi:polyhydroxybutyrate depolymerase